MDGHEVLRLLLDEDLTSEIPFIFGTSMAEKKDQLEALKFGADGYMIKPFELGTLLEVAKIVLNVEVKDTIVLIIDCKSVYIDYTQGQHAFRALYVKTG